MKRFLHQVNKKSLFLWIAILFSRVMTNLIWANSFSSGKSSYRNELKVLFYSFSSESSRNHCFLPSLSHCFLDSTKKRKRLITDINMTEINENQQIQEIKPLSSVLFTIRTPLLGLPSWTPKLHASVVIYDLESKSYSKIQNQTKVGDGTETASREGNENNNKYRAISKTLDSGFSEEYYDIFPVSIVDFIPINPTSLETLFTLLSGREVPGEIRIRKTFLLVSRDQSCQLSLERKPIMVSQISNMKHQGLEQPITSEIYKEKQYNDKKKNRKFSSIAGFFCNSKDVEELSFLKENDSIGIEDSNHFRSSIERRNKTKSNVSKVRLNRDCLYPIFLTKIGLSSKSVDERNRFLNDYIFTSLSLIKNNCYTFEAKFLEFLF